MGRAAHQAGASGLRPVWVLAGLRVGLATLVRREAKVGFVPNATDAARNTSGGFATQSIPHSLGA